MFVKIWTKINRNSTDVVDSSNKIISEDSVNKYEYKSQVEFNESVTSVELVKSLMIVGLENGDIFFYKLNENVLNFEINLMGKLSPNLSFGGKVTKIKSKINKEKILLGCCGDDNSVRIYSINTNLI